MLVIETSAKGGKGTEWAFEVWRVRTGMVEWIGLRGRWERGWSEGLDWAMLMSWSVERLV